MRASTTSSSLPARDAALAVLLALGTVVYLTGLPHNLGAADESNFIYEAKRLADGEVMYRDVFDLITPVSMYLTAFAFRVFGSDMSVARATIAVVHAVIVVAIYACSRLVGVRSGLAAAAALAHLAIGHPTWPYVSQHWFATAANILVLLSLLRCRWHEQPSWAAVPGVITGVLIGIQQQKGVPIAAGACVVFVATHLLTLRAQRPRPLRMLALQIGYFAAGLAAVVVPLFVLLIAAAGVEPLVQALITFPLVNYRHTYRSAWGGVQLFSNYYASFTFPTLLKLAPLSLAPIAIRLAATLVQPRQPQVVAQSVTLLVFVVATVASIAYYPDVIHLAFIAPVFLVVAAEALDWALSALGSRTAAIASAVFALCVIGTTTWQLRANWQRTWGMFSTPHDTAFGRMDLNDPSLIPVIDKARELVDASPSKEMFCYPSIAGPYLWTGAKNPTRYQYFSATYNDPAQGQEIIAILEARQTPFIMTSPLSVRKEDPIAQYLNAHYDVFRFGYLPKIWLYTRRPEGVRP